LRFSALAFRVMTPSAAQIASFEEYRGADPGTVNVGVALNIKNSSSKHGYSSIGQIVIV
jgi:hypothetical protein